jgi:hypothetical protein
MVRTLLGLGLPTCRPGWGGPSVKRHFNRQNSFIRAMLTSMVDLYYSVS